MAENQNIKERLFQYIEFKGISARRFSLECGFSANYATNISKGIPEDKMNTISVHFPDLNPAWLMTGEGEMLKDQAEAPEAGQTDAARIAQLRAEMDELKKQLDDERRNLLEQNKKLTDIIERLTKEG